MENTKFLNNKLTEDIILINGYVQNICSNNGITKEDNIHVSINVNTEMNISDEGLTIDKVFSDEATLTVNDLKNREDKEINNLCKEIVLNWKDIKEKINTAITNEKLKTDEYEYDSIVSFEL